MADFWERFRRFEMRVERFLWSPIGVRRGSSRARIALSLSDDVAGLYNQLPSATGRLNRTILSGNKGVQLSVESSVSP